jgi:beta-phosphoglucomutase-like phosphatase (HAD superfamily)
VNIRSIKRALILDFDGVVVDTEQLNYETWNLAFEELLGIRIDDGRQALVGLTLDEIYRLWTPDDLSEDLKLALLERKNTLYFERAEQLTAIPGCLDLVRRAHDLGWYTAIVSRSRRLRVLGTLDRVGAPALFDLILGFEDGVDHTVDRKDHARAARIFGIDLDHSIVIEDSPSGIADAVWCGIGTVIGITTTLGRDDLFAAGAHRVIDSYEELSLA